MATPAPPPSPDPFELASAALCLDFANTWGDRERPESDRLRSYGDLLSFARQAELLPASQLDGLVRRAAADPAATASSLSAARELREALYRLFAASARRREPAMDDLEQVNAALRATLPHLRLATRDGNYAWTWDDAGDDLLAPLRPVVHSAAELLAGADLRRVRECDGGSCTWLFLDRSRNRSRRWCAMKSCGNRAKAARHYQRKRAVTG